MTRTNQIRNDHYAMIAAATHKWNGIKEEEAAAICGLTEDQVYMAVKWAVKRGLLEKTSNGEIVIRNIVEEAKAS